VPEGVEVVPADADSLDFTERAAKGVAVVYQCLNTPYHKWPGLFPRVQDAAVDIPWHHDGSGARLIGCAPNLGAQVVTQRLAGYVTGCCRRS